MNSETFKYKSTVVAKYMLSKAIEAKYVTNMTKLQKLLYAAYGAFLVIFDERLMNEHPKAWPYGPVFPSTRNALLNIDFNAFQIDPCDSVFSEISKDDDVNDLIELILGAFGGWSAGQLTEWSHSAGSPWDRAVNTDGFNWNDTIPDEYIKEYFSTIVVKK